MSRTRLLLALLTVVLLGALTALPARASAAPIEDYADYRPQTTCSPKAKPGTVYLARFLVRKYGGGLGPTSRRCGGGGTSEHKEGRALDWTLDARKARDRKAAARLLERIFRTDSHGNADAWARRMGIMYVIWNDHMYSAWDEFAPEGYLSSSCKSKKKCSKTLRHRDHMHVSLSVVGAKGKTSWYAAHLGG